MLIHRLDTLRVYTYPWYIARIYCTFGTFRETEKQVMIRRRTPISHEEVAIVSQLCPFEILDGAARITPYITLSMESVALFLLGSALTSGLLSEVSEESRTPRRIDPHGILPAVQRAIGASSTLDDVVEIFRSAYFRCHGFSVSMASHTNL